MRNLLERACLLSDGDEIDVRHLPAGALQQMLHSTPQMAARAAIGDDELARLARSFAGNRKALARALGLSERTLYRRLKALGE